MGNELIVFNAILFLSLIFIWSCLFIIILCLIPAVLAANECHLKNNNCHAQSTNQHLQYTSPTHQQNNRHSPGANAYEKEYFFFSAPEEDTLDTEAVERLLNSFKKPQQVIFIKTPTNAAYEKALESFLRYSLEQHTHIYVFGQRSNFDGLIHTLQNSPKYTHPKPEVHFVKYKNPAQIHRIQSSIIDHFGAASDNKPVYALPPASDNVPVNKNYAMNFLPAGIDVVPGSSYIPLFLL